jgi:hypothetical protein
MSFLFVVRYLDLCRNQLFVLQFASAVVVMHQFDFRGRRNLGVVILLMCLVFRQLQEVVVRGGRDLARVV